MAGKLLWTFKDFGQRLGDVSERKARYVAKELGLVVVELGPRCVRLVPSECEAALARLPRKVSPSEPAQLLKGKLLRSKVEKLKRDGVPA